LKEVTYAERFGTNRVVNPTFDGRALSNANALCRLGRGMQNATHFELDEVAAMRNLFAAMLGVDADTKHCRASNSAMKRYNLPVILLTKRPTFLEKAAEPFEFHRRTIC
jgi:transketolase C-terminal domain/subunit